MTAALRHPRIAALHRTLCAAAGVLTLCAAGGTAWATDTRTILPPAIHASLARADDQSGEAVLRLTAPVALNGCPVVGPIKTDTAINPPYLDITIEGFTIDHTTMPARQGDCTAARQYARADIPLDRALLHGNDIREIRFTAAGQMDYYTVDLSAERLDLSPRRQMRIKPAGLTFWYYPEGTIILSAPAAPAGRDVTADLDSFAAARGLHRLDALIPAFAAVTGKAAAGKGAQGYYIDQSDAFSTVSGPDAAPVGTIQSAGKTMDVYGRRPGTND